MVLFIGTFLLNTLCAIVPCQKSYDPPVPVLMENTKPYQNIRLPILDENPSLIIKTESGFLQGFPMKTIKARDISAFTGIPYAESPVNELRYASPVMKIPWKGLFQATKLGSDCMQIDGMQLLRIIGSEDCLYANIYTPTLPRKDYHPKLPVMIFFHGGSFAFSSGSSFGPAYLLDRDVILVTFNYRLSSFGFLSTGDSSASGNWGMKDQNLLMSWVNKNIHAFGGDPNQVTLFGQSAGAVSTHLHILSPLSRGLFRTAISQSGNAFTFWGVRNSSIDYTLRLANALRCPVNESGLMVDCLRKLDPFLIMYTESTLPNYKVFPGVFFGPVVEPRGSNDAFLEERPEVTYALNKVPPIPWINGLLSDEGNGVGFLAWLYPLVMEEINRRWTELGPKVLDLDGDLKYMSKVAAHIRHFYFGNKAINFYTRRQLSMMVGDRLIVSAVHKGLKYHSKVAPTYGYYFNYTGRYGTAASQGLNNAEWGISHDDDLIYLLNNTEYQALRVGEPEYEMSEFMTNVWANFAIHGEPIYVTDDNKQIQIWDPIDDFTKNDMPIVLINGDMPKMIPFPFLHRVKFWDDMGLVSRSKIGPYTLMPKDPDKPTSFPDPVSTPIKFISQTHPIRNILDVLNSIEEMKKTNKKYS